MLSSNLRSLTHLQGTFADFTSYAVQYYNAAILSLKNTVLGYSPQQKGTLVTEVTRKSGGLSRHFAQLWLLYQPLFDVGGCKMDNIDICRQRGSSIFFSRVTFQIFAFVCFLFDYILHASSAIGRKKRECPPLRKGNRIYVNRI